MQVVYDSPNHFIKALLEEPTRNSDNLSSDITSEIHEQINPVWRDFKENQLNETRQDRNSRHHNLSNLGNDNENSEAYYLASNDEFINEPVSDELKSINLTKNPFAFVIHRPEFFNRANNTKKKVPIILQLFSPTKNEYNDTIIEKIDHKYIIPILEKLKEISFKHHASLQQNSIPSNAQPIQISQASTVTPLVHAAQNIKIIPPPYHQNTLKPYPGYLTDTGSYMPTLYSQYPVPQYPSAYDLFRQWPFSFPNYYPVVVRDPFQATMNYFPDMAQYSSASDVCHHGVPVPEYGRMRKVFEQSEEKINEKDTDQQTEPNFEFGKRRYDDNPTVEYVDHLREKRNVSGKKDVRRYTASELRRRQTTSEVKKEEPTNTKRATDVGPQISKLIVRRGGVAIAGAGGIATAGSGGTAIVGPGGTAFTTPASSGGVAMVGPGGKVVKVPDLTNVLYGRTTNVAATGAGHSTFTNKNGEVFTTSDNTGGVALVNPGGEVLGVSDDQNFETQNHISTRNAKEVQLPPGARLLTTGPIIYYNPVYPMNQLR